MKKLLATSILGALLISCAASLPITPVLNGPADITQPNVITPATSPLDNIARESAKAIIKPIVAAKFPGLPTDMLVGCVIDNATTPEILELGKSAVTGSTDASTSLTLNIIKRPATTNCIAKGATTLIAQ